MNVPVEQARPMYEAAVAFKKQGSWNWLSNEHIFGVRNPDNGETGYCCVMGNGGEMYGMAIYPGAEGLDMLLGMLRGQWDADLLFNQRCLMLSFEGRDDLLGEEYLQIRRLGITFRGKTAWPSFRSYEPGYLPEPLTGEQDIRFMTHCIRQACEMAAEMKDHPDRLLEQVKDKRFWVRAPKLNGNGDAGDWETRLEQAAEPTPSRKEAADPPLDELRCARLRKLPQPEHMVWEVGTAFMPAPVAEGGRPYYPQLLIIADQDSGMIIHMELKRREEMAAQLFDDLSSLLEKLNTRPSALLISDAPLLQRLSPLLDKIHVKGDRAEELPCVDDAIEGIMNHFG